MAKHNDTNDDLAVRIAHMRVFCAGLTHDDFTNLGGMNRGEDEGKGARTLRPPADFDAIETWADLSSALKYGRWREAWGCYCQLQSWVGKDTQ